MLKDKAILVEKKVRIPSGTKRDLRLTGPTCSYVWW